MISFLQDSLDFFRVIRQVQKHLYRFIKFFFTCLFIFLTLSFFSLFIFLVYVVYWDFFFRPILFLLLESLEQIYVDFIHNLFLNLIVELWTWFL